MLLSFDYQRALLISRRTSTKRAIDCTSICASFHITLLALYSLSIPSPTLKWKQQTSRRIYRFSEYTQGERVSKKIALAGGGYWITSLYEPFTFCCALWCCGSATEKQIRVSSKLKIYARVCRGCLYYLYICTLEATYIIPSYLSSTRPQKLDLVSKYWILFSFSLRLSIWLPNIEKWLCV